MPSLKDEIDQVRACIFDPPQGESNTCEWVILPLLWAAGYDRRDIHSRVRDSAGNFPDYSLLPGAPHTWFLEAKAWGTPLKDEHAAQAVNYANSQGKRWVVLTDGRIWRLYDNLIRDLPAEQRLVVETRLDDPDFEEFMTAIGKGSVVGEKLPCYAQRRRLRAILDAQLADPDSKVVRALRGLLRSEFTMSAVQGTDIVAYFAEHGTPATEHQHSPGKEHASGSTAVAGDTFPLDVLRGRIGELATGRKPDLLTLPDGSTREVRHWRSVAFESIRWLFAQSVPTLPFRGQEGGNRYFINTDPVHADGAEMRSAQVLDVGQRRVHIDTWRSAGDLIRCVVALCAEMGVSPSGFAVRLSPAAQGLED